MQVGQKTGADQLCARQEDILRLTCGDETTKYKTKEDGRSELSTVLEEKSILLVLDDLWEEDHLWLIPALGPGSRLLVTTRDEALVSRKTHTGWVRW